MSRLSLVVALGCCLLASSVASAEEEEKMVGSFEIVAVRSGLYRSLAIGEHQSAWGPPTILHDAPPGYVFAVIDATLRPTLDPVQKKVGIPVPCEELRLEHASGAAAAMSALRWKFDLQLSPDLEYSESSLRTADGGLHDLAFFPVFIVPQTTREATLRIGQASQKVEFDAKILNLPDPSKGLSFTILSAERKSGVEETDRLIDASGERTTVETVYRTTAEMVEVEVEFVAERSNTERGYGIEYYDLQFDAGDRRILLPLGRTDYPGMKLDGGGASYSLRQADGSYDATTMKILFPCPQGVEGGRLLYFGRPVAEFEIE